jgi:hypothetical protein
MDAETEIMVQDRRNPFGILPDTHEFEELLTFYYSVLVGSYRTTTQALEWLAEWQKEHPQAS